MPLASFQPRTNHLAVRWQMDIEPLKGKLRKLFSAPRFTIRQEIFNLRRSQSWHRQVALQASHGPDLQKRRCRDRLKVRRYFPTCVVESGIDESDI